MLTRITLALTRALSPIENSLTGLPDSRSGSKDSKRHSKQSQQQSSKELKVKSEGEAPRKTLESHQPKLALVSPTPQPAIKSADSDLFVQLNSLFKSVALKTSKHSVAQTYRVAVLGQKLGPKSQKGVIFDQTSNDKIE